MKANLLTLVGLHLGLAAVVAQPVITSQPQSQTNIVGATVTFSVGATGTPPLGYQWIFRNLGNPLPGATNNTLVLLNVQASNDGNYRVTITNAAGSLLSASARLTVVTPPTITPANPTANLFADVTLYATNGSGTPLTYQWLLNGAPIAGAVTNRLVVTNVQQTNAGAAYAVVSTYSFGSVTSQVATLTITPFTITPANPTASLFADVTLLFTNRLGTPLAYQWFFNGEPIGGAVTNGLVLTNVQKTNAGAYAIAITYAFGSVTSQVATLKIVPFNSIYCFGFSWTDTRGVGCGWNSPSYYMSRACNGPMWPEFLSTNLGLAYVEANNYAHCGATATDVLNQANSFPAPPKPQLSLYGLWAGDSDFLRGLPPDGFGSGYLDVTNEVAWNQLIQTLIASNSNAVNRLYTKGARAIVIQNQADYRGLPGARLAFGTNIVGLAKLSEYIARFNAGFIDAMNKYSQTRPDLRIVSVDTFSRINDVLATPAQYGFTKTNIGALQDQLLNDKSFTGPGADYVFWDSLHVTSKLNKLITGWSLETLTNSILEKLDVTITGSSPNVQMNRLLIGRDYTLQSSSDLMSWNDLQTFTAAAGTNQVTQALSAEAASVFYRLQWKP